MQDLASCPFERTPQADIFVGNDCPAYGTAEGQEELAPKSEVGTDAGIQLTVVKHTRDFFSALSRQICTAFHSNNHYPLYFCTLASQHFTTHHV